MWPAIFSTTGLIRLRPKCGLDRVSSSKTCCGASSRRRFHGHVTGAARCPAGKEERALRATATAVGRDSLTGTFGPIEIAVPRARLTTADGKTTEWKSQTLRAYQRRTLAADALIASTYLAGTNTRRGRRALAALFGGTGGKDTGSPTWRQGESDWEG